MICVRTFIPYERDVVELYNALWCVRYRVGETVEIDSRFFLNVLFVLFSHMYVR